MCCVIPPNSPETTFANVVSGEFGGITQHIGAYQIQHESNKLTFIDTPGHAAFTEMRARGSKLTDVVVLVVAADDGVKPQTIESIKHAKAANVPIVVAINKCDLPEADPQKIKNQLLEYELIAEDLSGDTLMVEISAKNKKNLDKLVESIVLQAEILDLKTDFESKATGIVLESKIDIGRGAVATVVVTSGTIKKGDFFVSGLKWGKVRALINDKGESVNEAPPSMPVEILGINGAAKSGDDFIVLDSEKEAKTLSETRADETKTGGSPLTFAKVKGLPPVLVSSALVSLNVLASFSESKTIKSSPDLAAPLIPRISTGIDGGASLTLSPLSLIKALTFPHFNPLTKKSPFLIVPDVTTTVATAPLPISILDSKTIPVALDSKSVFKSKISACRTIDSTNLSKFFLFFAEISTIKVSPDKSSAISSYSKSWFFIFCGSASGKSHLLIATTIGTFAALACFIDSIV